MTGFLYDELSAAVQSGAAGGECAWAERRGARCPLIGCGAIRKAGGGFFEPDAAAGFNAFVFGVLDGPHVCGAHTRSAWTPLDLAGVPVPLIDLAAWRPSDPATILLRRGAVAALGDWHLHATSSSDQPLQLFATPLAWATAAFKGVVVIDWHTVAPSLLEWAEIICETLELGETLEVELRKARRRIVPRLPKIAVLAG